MLQRKKLNDSVCYYSIEGKIIFVNRNNSKWFVINEIEYDRYSTVILNKIENTEEYRKLRGKKFFDDGGSKISFIYKRRYDKEFYQSYVEIVRGNEYHPDRQIIFLFVKNLEIK